MADTLLTDMLKSFGIIDADAHKAARGALVAAKVISARPNRVNIADDKKGAVRGAIESAFTWHCNRGDCRLQAARADAPMLLVEQRACDVCGGSSDAAALRRMAKAMRAADVSRLLVVGGSDVKEQEIRRMSPANADWRFIEGTTARDDRYYRGDNDWAEVIVIWGSTILNHKVSQHFNRKGDRRVVSVNRRGIAALADAVVIHLKQPLAE